MFQDPALPPPRIQATDPFMMRLSYQDQIEYMRLVQYFQYSDDRNKRNLGLSTFAKHISLIHRFIYRGDSQDTYRGLLCGIEFGIDSLLINTSRLKHLMCRSKSCMNGCFQKLGYAISRPVQDFQTLFSQSGSSFDNAFINPRQWCVRRLQDPTNAMTNFPAILSIQFAEDNSKHSESETISLHDRPNSLPAIWEVSSLLNHKSLPGLSLGYSP
ncbi:hypothetical protein TVAG_373300 [Trichomonas vaginalis G3]|uniref:Initiator binding domain-containing protein n=1 Tax=Trichomonas vaginalis (strain ATCC PRA-98 / G3) TaxID=412133 RepID=A2DZJ3_TRIV3|nr:transcription-initiator DNA-binding domain ibd family [Trichomonas vaginalis G3]EAY14197.1 hypothetical protein TVAG_373300 [Trichomonas vaginalis G3]KAI5539192.1 transcription-initiator DNA-binding domain ibd family [Trichomonas vaginalis G3]|eukprot:XP_001326420.1 hypothetical protein [Trichomonas vaginalis G3]